MLPFFYFNGCGPSPEEKAAHEKAKQDSIAAANKYKESGLQENTTKTKDTIGNVSIANTDTSNVNVPPADTENHNTLPTKDAGTPSEKLIEKQPLLKHILIPKEYTHTGLAVIVDSFMIVIFSALFISFFLLIISLVIKFMERDARKTIVMLDIFAAFFLLISAPYSWDSKTLWGFWVCFTVIIILSIYDLWISIKFIRELKKLKSDNSLPESV